MVSHAIASDSKQHDMTYGMTTCTLNGLSCSIELSEC